MGEPPTFVKADSLKQQIKGWLFGAFMLLSAMYGALFLFIPLTPLLFLLPQWWRDLADWFNGQWHIMASGAIRLWFGAKVRVIGDKIDSTEPAVMILNHRTSLDWFYLWTALYQQDTWLPISQKIALKGIAKHCPGAGWAMQCNNFIFLDRNFEKDKPRLVKLIDYYANIGNNYQILLFPEGTDKCRESVASNLRYCEKKGLTPHEYVMHPRTTGFVFMIQKMRKAGYIKYVYDITIGFKDKIVQSEFDIIVQGLCPQDIHFQIVKIPIDEIPEKDEEIVDWLENLWAEKDEKLRNFYNLSIDQTFDNTPGGKEYEMNPVDAWRQNLVVFSWLCTTIAWLLGYFFCSYEWYYGYSMLGILFYMGSFILYGGVEWLTIDKFYQHRLARKYSRSQLDKEIDQKQ